MTAHRRVGQMLPVASSFFEIIPHALLGPSPALPQLVWIELGGPKGGII